jgi:hypothetical protein
LRIRVKRLIFIVKGGQSRRPYLEGIMRKAMIGVAAAMVGSVVLLPGASAAPVISHASIKTDPGFLTVAAHRRAAAPVVRQSRSDITSFSSSSSATGGVGVNHPPKK